MAQGKPPISDRLYGMLLRVLPFEFRLEFGSDMEETFHQQRVETARDHGFAALLAMWWATIADIMRMAPREHVSVLGQDVRYALRMMRKNIGFTAAAVMILGLGIGVNTSIFSAVNSILLKPLPYHDGDGLVVLRQRQSKLGLNTGFSVKEIEDYRRQNRSLTGLVEYHSMTFTLLGRNEAHRVRTGVVSAGFFDLFGVRPLLGRTFVPADDRPDAVPVLVLSYEYWKRFEGGDPNVVGKIFQMNDKPHTVIGVLPSIPQYPNENDVYMPTTACPGRSSAFTISDRNSRMMSVFARLRPGVSMEQSQADLAAIMQGMKRENPKFYPDELGFQSSASALRGDLTTGAKPMLIALLGASAFVLLIACANVANLTMARMARREQELVIRTAVGAGNGRLLRQLLTESLIMAMLAAGVGMVFAIASIRLMTQFAGQLTPRAREISIDGWVLAFAILCASGTTIVFGSVAALYSRQDVSGGLKEGGRANAERSRRLVRSLLIAAQVAFSYVLLIGAGLMAHSLIQMNRVDAGFVPQRVFAVGFDRNWSKYRTMEQRRTYSNRLLTGVQSQPGVLMAAVSDSFPFDPDMMDMRWHFRIEGDARPRAVGPSAKSVRNASPDYFRTLGIRPLSGRTFLDSDAYDTPPVAIINRELATSVWGNADPIGRRISLEDDGPWLRIVGVVADTKEFGPIRETPSQIYVSNQQYPDPGSILVRTAGDPATVMNLVRKAILDVDRETAITKVETLEQARTDSVASPRTTARLFGLFAILAFVIALTGIGGMLALWVRQRTREIGIRMAMGARPHHILTTVIRQGMLLVAIGLSAGYVGAVALTRFLKTFLFQVEPTDATTYSLVSGLLLGAAFVACYLPAIRAARIDPQMALRCD